jgi:hypothetical protein
MHWGQGLQLSQQELLMSKDSRVTFQNKGLGIRQAMSQEPCLGSITCLLIFLTLAFLICKMEKITILIP